MARPIVYGPAGSTYVWSVRLALAEKGVTHELVDLPLGAHREEPHLSRHPFGNFEIAVEVLWWADPDFRGTAALRLHKDFEEWARAKGCRLASMSAIAGDDRLAGFYERSGYYPFETNFLKELA